jgi:hypothetical protein
MQYISNIPFQKFKASQHLQYITALLTGIKSVQLCTSRAFSLAKICFDLQQQVFIVYSFSIPEIHHSGYKI